MGEFFRKIPTTLSTARQKAAPASVGNYVLFAGSMGSDDADSSAVVDAYDTSLVRLIPTALSLARYGIGGASVGDYALFAGGYNSGNSNVVDVYDTSLTRSTPITLSSATLRPSGGSIGNYALFAGGNRATVDAYDTSLTRSNPTALSKSRYKPSSASVGNYLLFAGNDNGNTGGNVVDAYNTSLTRSNPTTLSWSYATQLGVSAKNDRKYAFFAREIQTNAYNTSLTRSIPSNLATTRNNLMGTSIYNYCLIAGGNYKSGSNWASNTSMEMYDASMTRSSLTITLSVGRYSGTGILFGDYALFAGGVYINGSYNTETKKNTVDAYGYKAFALKQMTKILIPIWDS